MTRKINHLLRISLMLMLGLLITVPLMADDRDMETKVSDMGLELAVKTALLDKIGWDMLDTDVEARDGHVTLLGDSDTRENSELAKEVALSVEGVTGVDNELKVVEMKSKDPVGEAFADGEDEVKDAILESRVKSALLAEIGLTAFDIEVEATGNTVSLRGELESDAQRQIALDTAEGISDVKKIVDLLKVKS